MKFNLFYGIFSVLICLSNGNLINLFEQWAAKHNINIDDNLIYDRIFNNWVENNEFITEINNMNLTYKLGHNAYSGYSSDEFSELMGFNNNRERNYLRGGSEVNIALNMDLLPTSIDWRSKGVVNGVKDQGQCGSCWSFSTISSVESAVAIKTGVLNVLSEQELVDCDNYKNGDATSNIKLDIS